MLQRLHARASVARRLSATQAVRLQGMRVGQALSQVLDPGRPALFAEDHPEQLLPAEQWEDPRQLAQLALLPQQVLALPPGADGDTAGPRRPGGMDPAERGDETGRGQQQQQQQQQATGAEGRAEEGREGPLTETDSDDDGGSVTSLTSSGSGSELEAYDLEESDEEGGPMLPAV